jgi:ABC-type multidrug transport system fused ATPase/permease subunit
MDLEFHLAHRSTDLLRNLNDSISHVFVFGVIGLVGFLGELTFVVCVGIALLALAPAAMAVFLAYVALSCWGIFAFIRPRARQSGHQMSTSSADMYRLGGDIVRGIREVRLANAAPFMVSKYMATRRSSTDAHRRSGFLSEAPRYLLEIVFVTGLALFAGVLLLTLDPETALPLLAFVVVIGFRLFPTLSRMLSFASLVRIGLPSLEAVKPHLELARAGAADHRDVSSSHPNRLRLEERISIVDVHYRYPGSHDEALKGVSLQLARGSSTALVGRSGSGKSTLADIVSGLLPPTSGSVEVDGLDISLHPHRWNASIGVVSQQPYILDATIRENVAFGLPDDEINDEWLALAVEQAGITELVASLPKGLDSRIGEDGSSISGGQRQRIGLARAFYKQPRFLLLDEATSALDSTTEARITETLAGLRGEVTILIIAHRLSTVQGCDQIAYVDDGRIRHVGSFAEVCAACSDFAEMVRLGTVDGDALV